MLTHRQIYRRMTVFPWLYFAIVVALAFGISWYVGFSVIDNRMRRFFVVDLEVFATQINVYAAFIQTVATVAIVFVTMFYARVTYRMVLQQEDARVAAVRPLLVVDVPEQALKDDLGEFVLEAISLRIWNAGRGPAVRLHGKGRILLHAKQRWVDLDRVLILPFEPEGATFLNPGESHDANVLFEDPLHP